MILSNFNDVIKYFEDYVNNYSTKIKNNQYANMPTEYTSVGIAFICYSLLLLSLLLSFLFSFLLHPFIFMNLRFRDISLFALRLVYNPLQSNKGYWVLCRLYNRKV